MSGSRKRSLSPTSTSRSGPITKSGSPYGLEGLKTVFSFFSKAPPKLGRLKSGFGFQDVKIDNQELDKFDKNVDSEKRRRISIQHTNKLKDLVPRGSVDFGSRGISKYGNLLNQIHEESDVAADSLERRATLVASDFEEERYDSPIPDIRDVRRQSVQMVNALVHQPLAQLANENIEEAGEDEQDDEQDQEEDEPQLAIEPVLFEQLYTDVEGNLVRPPFINLAPKERYRLLSIKRSIEASRALESRLKYMVNPHETESVLINNKVETGTQTLNLGYLRKKLNYNSFIIRDTKRVKGNNGAVFSGEFLYDVDEPKTEEAKFDGYLGGISKPKFKQDDQGRKELMEKIDVKLDSDYVTKTKLSDKIKIKDGTQNKQTIEPSQGFNFSINKSDLNKIININDQIKENRTEDRESGAESKENEAPKFSFGAKKVETISEEKKTDTPKFSFGGSKLPKEPESTSSTSKSTETPKFSFGDKTEEPKLPVGDKQVPSGTAKFSFGDKKIPSETPKFSFGDKKLPTEAPKFSFGSGSTPEAPEPKRKRALANDSELEKPKFLFGESKDTVNPTAAFNFGGNSSLKADSADKKDENQKPTLAFNFGTKAPEAEAKTPAFSFGSTATLKKDNPISFGAAKDTEKKVTSFSPSTTKKDVPAFSLGSTEKKDTPAFSFGSSTEKKDTPAFSFGSSTEKKDAPALSFGASKDTTTADSSSKQTTPFSFSSKEAEKKDTGFSFGASEKKDTGISLGASTGKDTPAFSFGENKNPPSTAFSFGKDTPSKPIEKPEPKAFSFGSQPTATPPIDSADRKSPFNFGVVNKPSFNFGATQMPSFSAPGSGPAPGAPTAPTVAGGQTASPFQFGAVEKPSLNRDSSPFGASNGFNGANNGFNGQTPVRKEATPFNFSRSTTTTPEFQAFPGPFAGQQQQQQPFGQPQAFGAQPQQFGAPQSFGTPGSTPGGTPVPGMVPGQPRPNRKFAKMRKRRT